VPVLNLGLPDHFVEHGTREELMTQIGLDGQGILRSIQKRLRSKDLDDSIASKRAS
jgi:1-deoxy-D-xylulose-5-phosphate synthase